jgi:Mrp family chromosome partitioning ATPase
MTTLANLKSTAQTVDTSLIGQRDLERDVQSARQIYETFLNRAKETRERERIETSNARAIAPAALVSRSPFPSRTLILGLAVAGGLGAGAALAFFFAHAKNAVTGPRQLRAVTGIESLRVAGAGGNSVLNTLNPFKRASHKLDRVVASPELTVAVRALRNELRDTPMRRGERTLLCASADASVDPAAIALTLAEAVAIGGERVLLIDADNLTGTLTTSLGQTGKPGVSDVLSGKSHINDAVVELKDRAIWVLARGTGEGARSPAQSAKLQQLISAAAAQFDYVVIVPGALLADPDALSLASLTDQIILTAREHETTVEAVQKAIRLLGRSQAKLRRTVLLTGASAFGS